MTRFWKKLSEKGYRDAAVESHHVFGLARQLRKLLEARKLTQSEVAKRTGLDQSVISRACDSAYGRTSVWTYIRIAQALDVAFQARFISFSDLEKSHAQIGQDVVSFADDECPNDDCSGPHYGEPVWFSHGADGPPPGICRHGFSFSACCSDRNIAPAQADDAVGQPPNNPI